MIFSSLEFLCVFLPLVVGIYYLIPSLRWKNALLICASLVFYAYGEPIYILLMVISILFNYILARVIDSSREKRGIAKIILLVSLMGNLGLLVVFKYAGFLIETWNDISGMSVKVPNIALPLGISFYTFQAISYMIDVYRGTVFVSKNLFKVMLYISFFPQLIAGPIVKYRDINEALDERTHNSVLFAGGLRRFIGGLSKKILIANAMGQVADAVFTTTAINLNIVTAWMGAIAYLFQIYYDFSGYSDMAIGLGKMFGFHFQENFQYPYAADSMKSFWRRWHISLSTWFKEYLYIPLGGNRKGKWRACLNRIVVFFFTGLWHGANWTFVVWGLWHGMFLLLEEYVPFMKKVPKFIRHMYTLLVVCVGFVIFRAESMSGGLLIVKEMFTGTSFTTAQISFAWQQLTPWFVGVLVVAVIGAGPIRPLADWIRGILVKEELCTKEKWIECTLSVACICLLAWCVIRMSGSTYNPFIYFRF